MTSKKWTQLSIKDEWISSAADSHANPTASQASDWARTTSATYGQRPPEPRPSARPAVVSFTLINAETDSPIAGFDPIPHGATIDLSKLPTKKLNIRANTAPRKVGSVRFGYDSDMNVRTESVPPYAFASDQQGDYQAWTPKPGTHTLNATPYTERNAAGAAGEPLSVTLKV